jgi:hypothetical protein
MRPNVRKRPREIKPDGDQGACEPDLKYGLVGVNVRGGGRRINGYDQRTPNEVNSSGHCRGFKQLEE